MNPDDPPFMKDSRAYSEHLKNFVLETFKDKTSAPMERGSN